MPKLFEESSCHCVDVKLLGDVEIAEVKKTFANCSDVIGNCAEVVRIERRLCLVLPDCGVTDEIETKIEE